MIFDDEEEFVRFTKHVYDKFDGRGLGFTNVPLLRSVRVSPWLLERTRGQFDMRPVSDEELSQARERLKARRAFDSKTIEDFLGPVPPGRDLQS